MRLNFVNITLQSRMAYNSNNKKAYYRFIIELYKSVKQEDIPDTQIIRNKFPQKGVFISYRTWMNIKSKKPSELSDGQLTLF